MTRMIGYAPKCTPQRGSPWLFIAGCRDLRREAVADFAKTCGQDWETLKREGWRIVRVEITSE
jgi:hypothetical protein